MPVSIMQFDKAKRYYDEGEGVDLLMGTANVGRAVLQLAKGELGRAEKTLTEVSQPQGLRTGRPGKGEA